MDLVENDVDTLHEEIGYLVGHLVGNDVDTLHEEKIHLVKFSFIRAIDSLGNCHKDKIVFILGKYCYLLLVREIDICSCKNGFEL